MTVRFSLAAVSVACALIGPGAAFAQRGAKGFASLDHEPVDDAMKNGAVVVRAGAFPHGPGVGPLFGARRQPDEVLDRLRRVLVEQLNRELALARRKMRIQHASIIPLPPLRRLHRPPLRR